MPLQVPCPTCRKPTPWHGNPDRPFCSERCRLVDLGNWADESYRIGGNPVDAAVGDDDEDEDDDRS